MKNHIATFLISLSMLLIGAFLGYYTDILKDKSKNKIQYLDVKATKIAESLKEISTENGKNIELRWNGKNISSVSELIIDFYNFSDVDFDGIPVYLDVFHPFGFEQKDIISIRGSNSKGIEDHLIMDGYPKALNNGSIRYAFKLGVLNRATTSSYDSAYKINILLTGSLVPDATVSINQKGVEKRDFDPSRFIELQRDYKKDAILIFLPIMLTLFFIWLTIRDKKDTLKYFIGLSKIYQDYLIKNANNLDLKNEQVINNLSIDLVQEIRLDIWRNKSKIDKLLLYRSPPKREELE